MGEDILQQLGAAPEETGEDTEEIKVEGKKKTSSKPIDDEVLQSMMANGDNTAGMFEPNESEVTDKDEKLHQDQDKEAKLKTKGDAKPSDKYVTEFQKDMQKNPENYYIDTPKGKMTVKEARDQGYDPVTHRFRKKQGDPKKEEELLSQVNEKDREGIKRMLDPSQVGLAPADAEAMGLKPDSPMIKRDQEVLGEGTNGPQGEQGLQPPMPNTAMPQANGLESLLGGNA